MRFCEVTGVRPLIDSVLPLAETREGFARLAKGDALREDRFHGLKTRQ
jgi:hypothetical protein